MKDLLKDCPFDLYRAVADWYEEQGNLIVADGLRQMAECELLPEYRRKSSDGWHIWGLSRDINLVNYLQKFIPPDNRTGETDEFRMPTANRQDFIIMFARAVGEFYVVNNF